MSENCHNTFVGTIACLILDKVRPDVYIKDDKIDPKRLDSVSKRLLAICVVQCGGIVPLSIRQDMGHVPKVVQLTRSKRTT